MSYQALARKWRPKNFTEVVGQGHVVKALANTLDQDRLHHAYLFTGTRGVGKTTLARIFAKCLNCEQEVNSTPCGECGACREIDEGRFIDLIEVDAASRTKVEDTRELLDNVLYSPTRGRYKVYLIDEVHMLSGHSFNALLKTLEEPPPHVKFLLATTNPQKLPVTVLSRCLQFNLKRLSGDAMAQHLEKLMQAEDLAFEKSALHSLARAADGSMRDALSLLDQAIVFSDGNVTDVAIHEMLGTVPREYLQKLMQALASHDAPAIMQSTHELSQLSADFNGLFEDIIHILHQVALVQAVPSILDTVDDTAIIKDLSEYLGAEEVQLFYQIALIGKRDLYLSTSPQSALEMTLLRMLSFKPAGPGKFNSNVAAEKATEININEAASSKPSAYLQDLRGGNVSWSKTVENLGIQGISYSLALNCSIKNITNESIVLNLSQKHEGIATDMVKQKLERALQKYFNNDISLVLEFSSQDIETPANKKDQAIEKKQVQAEKHVEEDEVVKAFKSRFGAEVIEGSVKPIEE